MQARGAPRQNATAKDSEWVRTRQALEKDKPADVNEVLFCHLFLQHRLSVSPTHSEEALSGDMGFCCSFNRVGKWCMCVCVRHSV